MVSSDPTYRALVFGASGITGWAVVREALQYPTSTTFDRIIGLTNRPLTKSEAILPEDERLELHSNVDLSAGVSAVEARLKRIDGIEGVTHVYFSCK
jgi:nucleoside-diphosphate-sugar epimerase